MHGELADVPRFFRVAPLGTQLHVQCDCLPGVDELRRWSNAAGFSIAVHLEAGMHTLRSALQREAHATAHHNVWTLGSYAECLGSVHLSTARRPPSEPPAGIAVYLYV